MENNKIKSNFTISNDNNFISKLYNTTPAQKKLLNEMATYKLKSMETAKKIENTGRVRGNKGSSLIERGAFRKTK